jgi:hypothetical protein
LTWNAFATFFPSYIGWYRDSYMVDVTESESDE